MDIIFKMTIPDEDVPTAVANGPGAEGDLPEWIANHFSSERHYFTDNLGFRFTIEVVDIN